MSMPKQNVVSVFHVIHLSHNNSLETDSFMQALRHFIARRGNIRVCYVVTMVLILREHKKN